MQIAGEHDCPRCGVIVGGKPYDVRCSRVKDLPVGHRPVQVIWRKRRYRCAERRCAQQPRAGAGCVCRVPGGPRRSGRRGRRSVGPRPG
ncbi:MAG: transposase family protein [Geodermatophilaceae bacterium]